MKHALIPVGSAQELDEDEASRVLFEEFQFFGEIVETEPMPLNEEQTMAESPRVFGDRHAR